MRGEWTIRVKISKQRLEALFALYLWLKDNCEIETEHDELLFEHIRVICKRLQSLLLLRDMTRKTFAIEMNGADIVAFMQVWKERDVTDHFAKLIILDIHKQIDKMQHQERVLNGNTIGAGKAELINV